MGKRVIYGVGPVYLYSRTNDYYSRNDRAIWASEFALGVDSSLDPARGLSKGR